MMDVDYDSLEEIKGRLDSIRRSLESAIYELESSSNHAKDRMSGNRMDIMMNLKDDDQKVMNEACNRINITIDFIERLQEQIENYMGCTME